MLAQLNYHSGQYPIIYLNNGKSTLNPKSWKTNHVNYQQLDAQQRTSASNTAFLQQRNHANTSLRVQQTVEPAGWHPNRNGLLIYNRGHLIAYSLTAGLNKITGKYQPSAVGDQDNPRNLFTETDFTNQMLQTIYETEVRHAIEHGKHVIFQATPIFRNNETDYDLLADLDMILIIQIGLNAISVQKFIEPIVIVNQMERLILMFICLMLSLE